MAPHPTQTLKPSAVLPLICLIIASSAPLPAHSKMKGFSDAFKDGRSIPQKHTCQGEDTPYRITWESSPKETQSVVLLIEDPDAPDPKNPKLVWDHWVVYNLPPEGSINPDEKTLPGKAKAGLNSWKKATFGGPCPPVGRHRYFHKFLALDQVLEFPEVPTKEELLKATQGHVLEKTQFIGTYQKK